MTQEYSPDSTPARAVDDVSAMPGHYGPPTTVVTKKRRPTPRRAAPRSQAARPGLPPSRPRSPGRRPLAYLGDSRGLTFLPAALLAMIVGTVGGLLDGTHSWVGTTFAVSFIGGCVLAALLVHREDLVTVAFMPPLLYLATATAIGYAQAMLANTAVSKAKYQVGYAMSFGARTMWWATAATALVVLIMFFVRRPAPRPVHAAPTFDGPADDASPADGYGPVADPLTSNGHASHAPFVGQEPYTGQEPPAPYTTGVN